MSTATTECPDCGGYGVMGGRGSFYDTPERGKPCGTCKGRGTVENGSSTTTNDD